MKVTSLFRLFSAVPVLFLASCASNPTPPGGGTAFYGQPGGYAAPGNPSAYQPPASSFRPRSRPPEIRAASYILIDARTGQTLAQRNADHVRPVASTQKLVTALVVCESGGLDRPLRVEASDTRVEPSKLGLRAGQVYSRRELVYAFLVKSANDAANALARDNAGSIPAFAQRMTWKARSVGATHSHFANPHGLSAAGNYSTARDMSRIAMAARRNPIIRDAVRRQHLSFHGHRLENTNNLLGKMSDCDGMKTGYTNAAGRCLISSAHRWGKEVILVQLGTKTKYIWDDGRAMMEWGLTQL